MDKCYLAILETIDGDQLGGIYVEADSPENAVMKVTEVLFLGDPEVLQKMKDLSVVREHPDGKEVGMLALDMSVRGPFPLVDEEWRGVFLTPDRVFKCPPPKDWYKEDWDEWEKEVK